MDQRDMYEAVKAGVTDAQRKLKQHRPTMMRIDPFDAQDEDGEPVRVVGIYDDDEDMKFIVIAEQEDGEIYPVAARGGIYKKKCRQVAIIAT